MTTRRFAEDTTVPAEKTVTEIKRYVEGKGARGWAYGEDNLGPGPGAVMVSFILNGRALRFTLHLPDPTAGEFVWKPPHRYTRRTAAQARAAWEQAVRTRHRALKLYIQGKFEAVEAGIVTELEAFLPEVVVPGGATVAEWAARELPEWLATGRPPMLPPARESGPGLKMLPGGGTMR